MSATVLIIDQDEEFASQLEEVLQGVGLEVSLTNDGKKGMDLATSAPPAAIVLCVELAKMSGYSVCAKIKKDNALKNVPVFITSSEATPETFEQHKKLKSRAEEYVKKPFPPAMLIEVMRPYIGSLMTLASADEEAMDIVDSNEAVEFEDNTPPELVAEGDETSEYVAPESEEPTAGTGIDVTDASALGAALGGSAGVGGLGVVATSEIYEEPESEALTTVGMPIPVPSRPPPPPTSGASAELARLRAQVAELEDRLSSTAIERDQAIANANAARAEADSAAMSLRPQAGVQGGGAREVVELKKERVQKEKEVIRLREELNAKENERMAWLEKETELDGKIVELEEAIELEKTARSQSEAKLAGEQARIAGLEQSHGQAVEDFRRRLQEGGDREVELNQRLEETQLALAASTETADQLGLHVNELEQENEQLRGVIVERDNEVAELKAKGSADEDEINRLRGELEAMSNEAGSLSEQLVAKTEEANALGVDKTSLEEQIETTKEELELTKLELEGNRETLESTKTELTSTKGTLEATKLELNGTKETLEATKLELDGTKETLELTKLELDGTKETLDMTSLELEGFRERTGQLEEEREQTHAFIAGSEDRRAKALKALEIATALLSDGAAEVAEAEVLEEADLIEAEPMSEVVEETN
ncbi:MAG: response regulator [Deltaproteobacteria bacterium]|nr:response regulator [Deltaproteobacteria bacterium]